MRIQDIEYIPQVKNFKLLAGADGLHRTIRNAVIFEYEDEKVYEKDYYHNDFIITSLVFAKNNPELVEPMIKKMIKLGASGIAIKQAYYSELPETVVKFADESHIPLFMFKDIYIEDVIVNIASYMQKERKYFIFQQEIDDCIAAIKTTNDNEEFQRIINSAFLGYIYTAYINSSPVADTILKGLMMRSNMFYRNNYQFFHYKKGIFILYNTDHMEKNYFIKRCFENIVENFGCSFSKCICGISSPISIASDFDRCFRESYFAALYSQQQQTNYSLYDSIGLYKFIFPMLLNKDCTREINHISSMLSSHAKELGYSPLTTILVFYQCSFNYNISAKELCQHPNTIRYRIAKIKELMNIKDTSEFELKCTLLYCFHQKIVL